MAIQSALYYSASCDTDGKPFEHEDYGTPLGKTAAEVTNWAITLGEWLVYQGRLLCDECVEALDKPGHDYVTTERTEPFCRICKQLPYGYGGQWSPEAAHPNVPMYGQEMIESERTS